MTVLTTTAMANIRNAVDEKRDTMSRSLQINDVDGGEVSTIIVPNGDVNATQIIERLWGDIEVQQIEPGATEYDNSLMSINFGVDGTMTRSIDGIIVDATAYDKPLNAKQFLDKVVSQFEPNLDYLDTLDIKGE